MLNEWLNAVALESSLLDCALSVRLKKRRRLPEKYEINFVSLSTGNALGVEKPEALTNESNLIRELMSLVIYTLIGV